jgi:hypothetical protein
MPAKMSRSAPRPPFRLREVSIAVRTGRPEKHQYSRRFGSHLGDPGFGVVRFSTFATVSARNGPEGPHLLPMAYRAECDERNAFSQFEMMS